MKQTFKALIKKIVLPIATVLLAIGVTFSLTYSDGTSRADATITTHSYNSDIPFFNDYFGNFYPDNDTSIDRWFDTLPQTTNYSNFCSLGTSTYENINGKTVFVDAFNRAYLDSLNDPNYGQFMLVYQCIQYKVAHPNEDVYISLSTYRLSITASACLKRDSIYFGYMRSLFDEEYDTHGFVRLSFMLVEAARMGIHVVLVPHLNSYGVRQYSATNKNGYAKRDEPSYKTYFSNALNKDCYSVYANGKKVSNFMKYKSVAWNVNNYGGTDMMHAKICAVSNYIDYLGNEHSSAIFITSSNIDANDYLGRNGNSWSQTGTIVSDHDDLYLVCKNYVDFISNYTEVYNAEVFRYTFREKIQKQIDLIISGNEDLIPNNEKMIYLGSENDHIFEMYFSPLGGGYGTWDLINNPYAKYLTEFNNGTGPYTFTWNSATYGMMRFFKETIESIICKKFHENPTINNRLYIHLEGFEKSSDYDDLVVGETIGFKLIEFDVSKVHSKDMLFAYNKNGTRHYISIISSCNFHDGALWYQANHNLVIHETTEVGHTFFDNLGEATTKGAIVKQL